MLTTLMQNAVPDDHRVKTFALTGTVVYACQLTGTGMATIASDAAAWILLRAVMTKPTRPADPTENSGAGGEKRCPIESAQV